MYHLAFRNMFPFQYVEEKTAHMGATGDFVAAHLTDNINKNRYRNVLPRNVANYARVTNVSILLAENTRVKLSVIEGEAGSDFINANYISIPAIAQNYELIIVRVCFLEPRKLILPLKGLYLQQCKTCESVVCCTNVNICKLENGVGSKCLGNFEFDQRV